MNKNNKDFNHYEKLLFKIIIGLGVVTVLYFALMILVLQQSMDYGNPIAMFNFVLILGSIAIFGVSIIRIILYLAKVKFNDTEATIWRSVLNMFLSVVTFAIQFLLMIVIALSNFT